MTQTEPENSSGSCCLFFPPWSLFVSPHLHPSHYHHPSHHPILGIGPILAVTQFQPYPFHSPPFGCPSLLERERWESPEVDGRLQDVTSSCMGKASEAATAEGGMGGWW